MSYVLNSGRSDIQGDVVRTFTHVADQEWFPNDPNDGKPCVELRSKDGRYGVILTAEAFSALENV